MNEWISTSNLMPPQGKVVLTKIDDEKGERNVQELKLVGRNLWFFPDGSMHVYYWPTHWKENVIAEEG